jgi:hypothetical protein
VGAPLAHDPDRIQQELRLLQFLCHPAPPVALRTRILRHLSGCRWQEPDHQVLFEALCEISTAVPRDLRALLPAQLTRKGFPALSFDVFFQPHGLSPDEAEQLARSLGRSL